jgi:hypothetical protein
LGHSGVQRRCESARMRRAAASDHKKQNPRPLPHRTASSVASGDTAQRLLVSCDSTQHLPRSYMFMDCTGDPCDALASQESQSCCLCVETWREQDTSAHCLFTAIRQVKKARARWDGMGWPWDASKGSGGSHRALAIITRTAQTQDRNLLRPVKLVAPRSRLRTKSRSRRAAAVRHARTPAQSRRALPLGVYQRSGCLA